MFPQPSVNDRQSGKIETVERDRAGGWLQWPLARQNARLRLFCFHPAGVGAAVYRDWGSSISPSIEVVAVQLPGRGDRLSERPIKTIPAIVDALVPIVSPHCDHPFAFFGHSMGAVLALELCRALRDRGLAQPVKLVVSGRRPPTIPDPFPPLRQLSDDEFVVEINRRYRAIPNEILDNPDVLELLLPCLRADIAALEEFRSPPGPMLDIPIAVFGGDSDRQVPVEDLEQWSDQTTANVVFKVFAGDHFYLVPRRDEVVAELNAILVPPHPVAEGTAPL